MWVDGGLFRHVRGNNGFYLFCWCLYNNNSHFRITVSRFGYRFARILCFYFFCFSLFFLFTYRWRRACGGFFAFLLLRGDMALRPGFLSSCFLFSQFLDIDRRCFLLREYFDIFTPLYTYQHVGGWGGSHSFTYLIRGYSYKTETPGAPSSKNHTIRVFFSPGNK